jgi:hypothetical protein
MCGRCGTMQSLQHLEILTTSSLKILQCNHVLKISEAMDLVGNPLDKSCIGTYKHTKEIRHSLHKSNAPSTNVQEYVNVYQV